MIVVEIPASGGSTREFHRERARTMERRPARSSSLSLLCGLRNRIALGDPAFNTLGVFEDVRVAHRAASRAASCRLAGHFRLAQYVTTRAAFDGSALWIASSVASGLRVSAFGIRRPSSYLPVLASTSVRLAPELIKDFNADVLISTMGALAVLHLHCPFVMPQCLQLILSAVPHEGHLPAPCRCDLHIEQHPDTATATARTILHTIIDLFILHPFVSFVTPLSAEHALDPFPRSPPPFLSPPPSHIIS